MKKFILKSANRVLTAYRYFTEADMFVYAANAALFFEIAAFPLTILLLSLLRYFPMLKPEQLRITLLELFPAVPEISSAVSAIAAELERESSTAVSWVSGLAALYSASTGVFSIMKGLARLYHIRKQSWMKYRLIALFYTLALLALVILTLGTQLSARIFVGLLNSQMEIPGLRELSDTVIPVLRYFQIFTTAATFLLALGLYGFPFEQKKKIRNLVPGAVFTAAGWFLAAKVFTFYIGRFWKPSVIYGSLTAVVLIVLWGYIIMSILFMGAAVSKAVIEEKKAEQKTAEQKTAEQKTDKKTGK